MPGVRMSDLRSVQFDVCDGDDEVVSIASDIYINKYSVQFNMWSSTVLNDPKENNVNGSFKASCKTAFHSHFTLCS